MVGSVNVFYGVCVGDWGKLAANVVPRLGGRPLLALSGQTSIAAAYNTILDAVMWRDVDLLILQHDDLEIVDPDGEAKLRAAVTAGAGVVGVAGGAHRGDIAWWAHEPAGHVRFSDGQMIDWGVRSGPVDLLEGSLLAFPAATLNKIRFDEAYPGFHGYDADISRQVAYLGLPVMVADVDVWHHTTLGFKTEQSHTDWLAANDIFRGKWVDPGA